LVKEEKMKRRESKFVHASPRLAPDQITATPRLRDDRPRPIGKGARKDAGTGAAAGRLRGRKRVREER
jgi:hypothetical protein